MNWDNLDWKNFSCVRMARDIKNELSIKYPTTDALYHHLVDTREETRAFVAKIKEKQSKRVLALSVE